MSGPIVIVGASLTGGTAAATLRDQGYDGRIVLIGSEPHPPYERPPLSKEFLRGEAPFEKALVKPAGFWEENEIETRFGTTVERIDTAAREVELAAAERIAYDKLLIATGVRNRRPPIPGIELDGVLQLRSVEDSENIRAHVSGAHRAVVIGMGFIGAEVAASLRTVGCDVTVVEIFETTLYRILGPEIGGVLEAIHRDHGVRMVFNDSVERFEGLGVKVIRASARFTGPDTVEADGATIKARRFVLATGSRAAHPPI
ncbi:MAG: NAD(P)/FAD-dependent oxidoreductase, partial [Actinomycetota bacterium]